MNLLLSRIREVFPEFNKIAVTTEEFWRVCKKRKVIVRELPLLVNGYYERYLGRDYILLNNKLTPRQWLLTALHEWSHLQFDAPGEAEHYTLYRRACGLVDDPRERFADAFALVAVMPYRDLVRLSREDLSDDVWLMNLCRSRESVRNEFGM
jgi:Zn-dependent peptidase ImmA (M78 family)